MAESAKRRGTGIGDPSVARELDTAELAPKGGETAAPEPALFTEPATREEAWPRTIRTTMEPHREYQVEESEYRYLKHQGLIKEDRGE